MSSYPSCLPFISGAVFIRLYTILIPVHTYILYIYRSELALLIDQSHQSSIRLETTTSQWQAVSRSLGHEFPAAKLDADM